MKYFLAAIALVLAPLGLAQTQPAAAQTVESEQAFAQWMLRVSAVIERASAVNNLLSEFHASYNPNASRADQLAGMRAVREHAQRSRPMLMAYGEELRAIGPFQHPGADPELVEFSRTAIEDTQIYLRNMDEILGVLIEATDAYERNDRAAFASLGPRLIRGASLLIEGQIVMFRGRQRTVPVEESAHHGLGAMVALYEGMRALVMPNVPDRAAAVNAAADNAAGWSASGRAALTRQRAMMVGFPPVQQRAIDQMFALEDQFYVANDRAVALFRAAARDAAAGASAQDLNARYTAQIAAIEVEYQRINSEQVALYSQMTQASQ